MIFLGEKFCFLEAGNGEREIILIEKCFLLFKSECYGGYDNNDIGVCGVN